MSKQIINIGAAPNDGTGDTIRDAMSKSKANFDELYDSGTSTTTATFTTPAGVFVGTPSVPLTNVIPLDTTGAVNGGVAAVYFKGAAAPTFSGGTVVILSGGFVVNELCLVFIIYDKINNSFSVNIQSGFAGSIPVPADAPSKMTITGIFDIIGGDVTPPAKMIITGLIDSLTDVTPPAPMILTNIL